MFSPSGFSSNAKNRKKAASKSPHNWLQNSLMRPPDGRRMILPRVCEQLWWIQLFTTPRGAADKNRIAAARPPHVESPCLCEWGLLALLYPRLALPSSVVKTMTFRLPNRNTPQYYPNFILFFSCSSFRCCHKSCSHFCWILRAWVNPFLKHL